MDNKIDLLAPENLPLDLGELGTVTKAELTMPGVYNAVLEFSETGLAELFHGSSSTADMAVPGYLFFTKANSSVPLFELVSAIPKEQLCCEVNRAALMNAVYQYFPEYAAQHNLAEQAGLNDGLGQFLHTQGINVELKSAPERLISLTVEAGTKYIDF